jgi:hypothetical protein
MMLNSRFFLCLLLLLSNGINAHHSNAEYDRSVVTELTGVISRVIWRNPHVGLWVDVVNENGVTDTWRMEAADLLGTQRRGVSVGTFDIGQQVTVAGFSSTRREAHMLVTNVLLPNDMEVLLTGAAQPRWSDRILGGGNWVAAAAESEATQLDMFRVWTQESTNRPDFAENPPFTTSARLAFEQYDSYDDPALQCIQLGMPRVITFAGPHPIEFEQRGENIVLIGEYFDIERVIHMNQASIPDSAQYSPLGYSIGRWEGEGNERALIIETEKINYPFFDIRGISGAPKSMEAKYTERFWLNADGTELHYDFTMTDPGTFTETVTAEDYAVWKWRPEIRIMPYQCEVD